MKNHSVVLRDVGGFIPEPDAPTCTGLGRVAHKMMEMTMEDRVLTSKIVMDAIWSQLPSPDVDKIYHPAFENYLDLVEALSKGWAYNANEADNIFVWFGDIRSIKDAISGAYLGAGLMAPDGSLIRDGRDLVDWRDFRWAGARVARYLSGAATLA
jgi:hypothetical protein